MRLKMRIVLFGLMLLMGQKMRADCMALSWTNFQDKNWFYTSRPLLWFNFNYYDSTDVPVFRHGRPYIFCGKDTIPLQAIDSIINTRNQQWLLRPVRAMQKDSVYRLFTADSVTWDPALDLQYNLYSVRGSVMYATPPASGIQPPRLTGDIKVESVHDSAGEICGGYTGLTLLIPRADTTQWIVKGVFTDTETGKQLTGYGVCDDSLVSFGRSSCTQELLLDGDKKYTLQLILIDSDNNRTTVQFPDVIDFYPEERFFTNFLWIVGSVLVLAFTAIWFLLKKQRRKTS